MFSHVRLDVLSTWIHAKTDVKVPRTAVTDIISDSRSVRPGTVFVALKGENFDGHDYLEEAAKMGAIAAIVDRKPKTNIGSMVLLEVPKPLTAMAEIARQLRKLFDGPVIAITGSAGKSSTKNMLASLLGPQTMSSPKSFNNLLGVSKTLFLLEDGTRKAVLEVGMNAEGEIAEICKYALPDLALITNIGTAHIGRLGGQEGIYRAKKELFDFVAQSASAKRGVAINIDDPLVVRAAKESLPADMKRITYSASGAKADVQILKKSLHPKTGALQVELAFGGKTEAHEIPVFGLHQAENLAAAVAGAMLMGQTTDGIRKSLPSIKSAEHRGEVFQSKRGVFVLDESYNSNPSALAASLQSAFELNPVQRRVLVLGEMRELDDFSDSLHEKSADALIELAKQKKIPFVLVGVGAKFAPFTAKIRKVLPMVAVTDVATAADAIKVLEDILKAGDIVLVKGSRGIALDQVVKWLTG